MTITLFEHIVKCAQKDMYGTFHYLDGSIETKLISKAHSIQHLRGTMMETIDIIIHPEYFYYGPDYPDGFPENFW